MSDRAYNQTGVGQGKWNIGLLNELGFRKGSVLRVSMKNFLTYDSCEVFPGPRLNVILGPNGTGKSTVTHAICLACCGGPKTVGRSTDIKQFVKHNKEGEECFVEVDLFYQPAGEGKVLRIRRILDSESATSKWFIDGKKNTQTQVQDYMKELKIDVDNLCSFMPQDKVGNFSQQTPQGILQKTLEAITSDDEENKSLHEIQKELGELQSSKDEHCSKLDAKEKALDKYQKDLDQMEGDVQRINARRENATLLEMLQFKKVIESAEHFKAELKTLQDDVHLAEVELLARQESIAPLETYQRELKKRIGIREKATEEWHNKYHKLDDKMKLTKKTALELDEQLNELSEKLKHSVRNRLRLEKERNECTKQLSSCEQSLRQAHENKPKINDKLKEVSETIAKKEALVEPLSEDLAAKQEEMATLEFELKTVDREMKNIKDPLVSFKNRVMGINQVKYGNEAKFWETFQATKDSAGFEKEVYGPVGAFLNFKDPVIAAMVEKALPVNKMFGYVVQTIRDEKTLRKMNPKLNIFTIFNVSSPPRPYNKDALRDSSIPGLQGYLTDQVECPPVIKAFLHDSGSLNSYLYAKTGRLSDIKDDHFENLCPRRQNGPPYYNLFVQATSGSFAVDFHTGSRSKYDNDNLSKKTEAVNAGRFLLPDKSSAPSAGGASATDLEHKKNDLVKKRTVLLSSLKGAQTELAALRDEISKLNSTKRDLSAKLKEPNNLEQKLSKLKTDLKRFHDKLAKDPAAENKQILDVRKVTIRKIVDCVGEISRVVLDRRELDNTIAIEHECHKVLYQALDDAHDAVSEARKSLEQLKINKKSAERRRDEVKVKVEECRNELTELKEMHCDGDDSSFREYFKKVMDATGDYKGLDAINRRITQLELELERSVDNQALLTQYSNTKRDRDSTQIDVNALTAAHEKMIEDIETRSKNWFTQVEGIQQKLDMQFNKYMEELGYEGAVELRKIGNVDKHEMQMRVNFNQGTLTDLSGQRHSGGERAVSTIMYLMALQEMTHTPFRAVDEINQGMDERNERLVFDRIVQTCCLPGRPQYFLVSPKLLQGLRAMEHDDVTVLMVWNGPGVTYSWKFTEIVDSILSGKRGRQQDDASDQRGPARKR